MAARKNILERQNYIYLGVGESVNPMINSDHFELDEADIVWNSNGEIVINPPEPKKSIPNSRLPARKSAAGKRGEITVGRRNAAAASLPVSIPDWSKILRDEYKNRQSENEDRNDDDDYGSGGDDYEDDDRVPPHEYLARTRIASFSVHEGIGRTLKGRDLSRVRNAIWKQTGFED